MISFSTSRCPTVSPDTFSGYPLRVGWSLFVVIWLMSSIAVAQPPSSNQSADMWRPYRKPGTAVPNRDTQPPAKPATQELPRRSTNDPFADDLSGGDIAPPTDNASQEGGAAAGSQIALASHEEESLPQEPAPFQIPPGLDVPPSANLVGAGNPVGRVARASFDPMLIESMDGEVYEDYGGEGAIVGGCANCGGNCGASGINYCQATWTFSAEYLLWSMSGFDIPALVTSSQAGTPRTDAGILGEPNTRVLFGQQTVVDGTRSGSRFSLSRVLDPSGMKTIELSYFFLGKTSDSFNANSDGAGILARPFYSVESGAMGPNAELVAFPGVLEGNISVSASTQMQGGGLVAYQVIDRSDCRQIRLFAGYNYHELEESVQVQDFKRTLDSSLGLAVGTTIAESDRFDTDNQISSFVLGADLHARHRRWSVGMMMKLGFGNNRATATLDGSTTTTVPLAGGDDVSTVNTGLLVLESNRGVYEGNEFTMIPQLGLDVGFQLTRGWSAHVGYDFIYWSRVVRPGDQIDTNLNLSQLAAGGLSGLPAPTMPWKVSDLRVHAVDFGLQFAY
ncbi:hypothetical protein Poly24_35460 [Rosistilla carotiformis]|uniref:Uncharacterized protein n=1 Tax=Rosistilla carotiformis TaxID=2528017 RepID=A0A518JWB0_9BACT|nr:BBP7 family outer membrane beta-barrel protein [Rosistilla carotiformis]QDV69829.1 hypothetical protein Poly24_35460 [Rosistilla carotiformis]